MPIDDRTTRGKRVEVGSDGIYQRGPNSKLLAHAWPGMWIATVWLWFNNGSPEDDKDDAEISVDVHIPVGDAMRLYKDLGDAIEEARQEAVKHVDTFPEDAYLLEQFKEPAPPPEPPESETDGK